jgi:hypothetical protein
MGLGVEEEADHGKFTRGISFSMPKVGGGAGVGVGDG